MATTANTTESTSFFANATANRVGQVPGALLLTRWANQPQGKGGAAAYNSRVLASQQNGAGPAVAPIRAPWSFQDFATGFRTTITRGMKKKLGK